MKNILVSTDFSAAAWNAISYAIDFYKEDTCTFYLLNTYTPPISSSRFMADVVQNILKENISAKTSEQGLELTLGKIRKNYNNPLHTYKTISSFSLLIDEVKEAVSDFNIDMIVLGANGISANKNLFMGSTAVRIVRTIHNCPILIVPNAAYSLPGKIALATDFNHFYSEVNLVPLLAVAKKYKTPVQILNIQEKLNDLTELQRFNYTKLNKDLDSIPHTFYNLNYSKKLVLALQEFIASFSISLLTMSNCNNSFMDVWCKEIVVHSSDFFLEIPLLLLPDLEKETNNGQRETTTYSTLNKQV